MKTIAASFLIVITLLSSSCKKEEKVESKGPVPINLPEKAGAMIKQSNSFGIDLFRETAIGEEANLMLSPLSASTALSMLLNGCGGETYTQIRDLLGYNDLSMEDINEIYHSLVSQLLNVDPAVQLSLANAVWYRKDFAVKPAFLESMSVSYDAKTEALDFASPSALTTINNWAKDNTNGKIEKVLDEITPETVMFLMNALYFKGNWTYQFDKTLTEQRPFYPESGDPQNVEMMHSELPFRTYAGDDFKAVELPYGQQNFSMVIVLPNASLESYLGSFNGNTWEEITASLAIVEPVSNEITLPKFKFDFEKMLNEQLKSLGMTDAFNPYTANLSGISDASIYVSFVKQNTYVDVNEEGTEAAAVTTIGIDYTSIPESVVVNKPFIFAIRERTSNTLLFIGKVEMPEY
ncbi:MAG: serpin family protein [Lentimicrobium sp.]|jgi:serpin B|nr:serpin family protein [Lentimicrobium sp.]